MLNNIVRNKATHQRNIDNFIRANESYTGEVHKRMLCVRIAPRQPNNEHRPTKYKRNFKQKVIIYHAETFHLLHTAPHTPSANICMHACCSMLTPPHAHLTHHRVRTDANSQAIFSGVCSTRMNTPSLGAAPSL